jgi:hypothetical protein
MKTAPWRWSPRTGRSLEAFAFTLLQNEVLEREEIERIVNSYKGENGTAPQRTEEPGPAKITASERS